MDAVDAAAGPEVDDDELAFELLIERPGLIVLGVQPGDVPWHFCVRKLVAKASDPVSVLAHLHEVPLRTLAVARFLAHEGEPLGQGLALVRRLRLDLLPLVHGSLQCLRVLSVG